MSFKDDLQKIMGVKKIPDKIAAKSPVLGGRGGSRASTPSKAAATVCYNALTVADGSASGTDAHIIDGFIEANTGRRVRVFLDADAMACTDAVASDKLFFTIKNIVKYTGYNLEANVATEDVSAADRKVLFLINGIAGLPAGETLSESYDFDTNNSLNVLTKTALDAEFYGTKGITTPDKSDAHKAAVAEVEDFFKTALTGFYADKVLCACFANKTGAVYDADYSSASIVSQFRPEPALGLTSGSYRYSLIGDMPEKGWSIVTDINTEGRVTVGYGDGSTSNGYDVRKQVADGIVTWNFHSYQPNIALPRLVWCGSGGGQYANCVFSAALKSGDTYTYVKDIAQTGIVTTWAMKAYGDKAVIDLKFNAATAKFEPSHPDNNELIPPGLKNLSSISLKDIDDNAYSLTKTTSGFLLSGASNFTINANYELSAL